MTGSRLRVVLFTAAVAVLITRPSAAADRLIQPLDGTWQIVFDPENVGRAEQWQTEKVFPTLSNRRSITVPSCWERIEKDYEGVAFYGTTFKVPLTWKNRTVRLHFDAVNYIAEVYLNDHVVGRHEGGYGPFEFQVDDLLKLGDQNFLSLRVIGPIVAQNKVIDGLGQSDMPHWRGAIAGGIWQSVRLIATSSMFVDSVFVEPRLSDGSVTAHVTLQNAQPVAQTADMILSVASADAPDKLVAQERETLSLVPGATQRMWTLNLGEVRCWSPDAPHLYVATIQLKTRADAVSDVHKTRFGMRELTIRDNRFELNGRPIYIKAAFFEGLYPNGLAAPDSDEMARREIQLAKEAGFNMIRPWRKPPPPAWLDLCDEMGVMVVGSMPIECMRRWPTVTPHLRDRIENEVRSAVLRDRNRACIVQWEIFNEIRREDLQRLKHPASMLARRLDPSRLILDESGGFAGGSNVYLPYQYEPEVFNDVHSYPGAPLNDASYDKFLTLSKTPDEIKAMGLLPGRFTASKTTPGRLTVVSEIGYGSLPDLVDNNARFAKTGNPLVPPYRYCQTLADSIRGVLKESGLDAVYPDLREFCLDQQAIHSQANKRMIEAIRSNGSTGGYAVHALVGGDWVLGAGLLDLFRNPKGSYWGTKEANQPRYLAVRVRPRNVYAARGATISITGINDLSSVDGKLRIDVVSADDTRIDRRERDVSLVSGRSILFREKLNTDELAGTYTVHATLIGKGGSVVAENSVDIDVFSEKQLVTPRARITVLDVNNSLRPFLKASNVSFTELSADTPTSIPVFVSKPLANKARGKAIFETLERFVNQGGTAVYLETVQRRPQNQFWGGKLPAQNVLPIHAAIQHAMGLWVGVSHVVTEHPIFDGLPVNCMMGQVYENVWSPQTLTETGGDLIVGSISHGWYQGEPDKQNYLGPSAAWYGIDLGIVEHGQGRYVLSTLRLLENLGTDPVADKILLNLIRWSASKTK